jgi:hypothetical protein
MHVIEQLNALLHRQMPWLIVAAAAAWIALTCGWSLYAFAHPL